MTKIEYEKQIAKLMKSLDLTRAEAEEMLAEDLELDKMTVKELNSDLTKDQKKAIKDVSGTGTHQTAKGEKKPREKKIDLEKQEIIRQIAEIFAKNAVITNKEREISLEINGNSYSITLTKHRKPKE